ncbi:hypothetical protein [Variovorax atrisoli]|uniref:hypothetical protein n=1 Tax=Variovorax atrisoli TaxID=3394203 RepID=UPI0016152BAA|nr:hypothetical protein [Variovorax sp. BK613]MBB3639265.1 hypothetical protein [Variovorax sp. BK613]
MITFSTEFPLDPKNTTADVLHLACEWLAGSPHSSLPDEDLESLPVDDVREVRVGHETAVLGSVSADGQEIAGLQYRRMEGELEWVTSIVARKDATETLFSLQVSCEALGTAVRLPVPKKPYFIKQALSALGGGSDGEIPVGDKPLFLSDGDMHIAAALIKGEAKNRLPIVYLSVDFRGQVAVDPAVLAKFIAGLAHVVVEPSRAFSAALRQLVDGRNVYGGALGVYWPYSSARKSYYLDRFSQDARAMQRAISDDLRVALANRRLSSGCTWSHLQEQISRRRIDRLRSTGSASVDDYITAFDAEIKAKDQRLGDADAEIRRLNADLRRMSASAGSSSAGLLKLGTEHDLWPNEVRDLVVAVLHDAVRNLKDGSRRQHVVQDLLEANPEGTEAASMAADVKAALRTYRSMDAKVRGALASLGFTIAEDGKHYKAIFRGDSRYMFTLPKTSSDHRAGKNVVSDITSTLF